MKKNYEDCLAAVLKYEGGYVNDPRDPGGATMKGITQGTYNAWRKKQGLPTQPVRQIAQSEVEAIYKRDYWDKVRGDELPSGVDLATFDYAVNSGPIKAIKQLQGALGIPQTGVMDNGTVAAAQNHPGVWAALCERRLAFLKSLPTWGTFGKGWGARVTDVKKKAANLAANLPSPPVATHVPVIDVAAAQKRLVSLSYPVGGVDGSIGPLTRSAIRDFQDAMEMPVTGQLDQKTYDALMSDRALKRPVSAEREALTAADLKAKGSEIINATETIKGNIATASAALAGASGVATQVKDAADQVQTIKDAVKTGQDNLSLVAQNWQLVVIGILLIVVAVCIYKCWKYANAIEEARVRQARAGENVRV